jgi:hypothetical protein
LLVALACQTAPPLPQALTARLLELLPPASLRAKCDPKSGNTAAHLACQYGAAGLLSELASLLPPDFLSAANGHGDTPLMFAAACGRHRALEMVLAALPRDDRSKRGHVNVQNHDHDSALHLACRSLDAAAIALLLDHGASPKLVGGVSSRVSALEAAREARAKAKGPVGEDVDRCIARMEEVARQEQAEEDAWVAEAAEAAGDVGRPAPKKKKKKKKKSSKGGGGGSLPTNTNPPEVPSTAPLARTLESGLVISARANVSDLLPDADETAVPSQAPPAPTLQELFRGACCDFSTSPDEAASLELTPDLMLQTAHQLAMASGSQIELVLKILERQTTRCREAKEIQMRMRSQAAAALI